MYIILILIQLCTKALKSEEYPTWKPTFQYLISRSFSQLRKTLPISRLEFSKVGYKTKMLMHK